MKFTSLAFILLFATYFASAQSSVPGYYVTLGNDTIATQIKIKKGVFGQSINDFIDEVEVIDSIKGLVKYLPADIKGYGFIRNGARYVFVSKPIKNGTKKFLSPLYLGRKSSVYLYGNLTTGGGYALPSKQVFYTFEKSDSSYLFLKNMLNKQFKSQVKEFYKDDEAVSAFIDTKLRYWLDLDRDLIEILRKVNAE